MDSADQKETLEEFVSEAEGGNATCPMMRHDDMTQLKLVSWWSFCPTYWLVLCPSFQASALEWCWPIFHVYHPSCLHGAQCSGAKGWTGPRTCSTFTRGTASSTGGAASLSFGVVRRYKIVRCEGPMLWQPNRPIIVVFFAWCSAINPGIGDFGGETAQEGIQVRKEASAQERSPNCRNYTCRIRWRRDLGNGMMVLEIIECVQPLHNLTSKRHKSFW